MKQDDDTLPSVNTSNIATHGVSNNYNSGDQDMDTNQDMDATDFNMPCHALNLTMYCVICISMYLHCYIYVYVTVG